MLNVVESEKYPTIEIPVCALMISVVGKLSIFLSKIRTHDRLTNRVNKKTTMAVTDIFWLISPKDNATTNEINNATAKTISILFKFHST
jgi:hypothetical protein